MKTTHYYNSVFRIINIPTILFFDVPLFCIFFLFIYRAWLERNPMLLATAVYTFLRLLEDHEAAPLKNLQQMEIEFCVALLREKVK